MLKMNRTNVVKHKSVKINKFKHFISYMRDYIDPDNPKNKDSPYISAVKILICVSMIICSSMFSLYIIVLIIYGIGYASVSVSPRLEHHTKNETMITHDYTEDGAINLCVFLIFIFIIQAVYVGIIIPVRRWRTVLEKEQKDLELGNAIE